MNDTSREIALMVHERYAKIHPVERFIIGVSKFETARAIVLGSFPVDLSPESLRRKLCERLYPELAARGYGDDQPYRGS